MENPQNVEEEYNDQDLGDYDLDQYNKDEE